MQVKSIADSAILSLFIMLPFVFKTFDLSIFKNGRLRQVLLYMTCNHKSVPYTPQTYFLSKRFRVHDAN